MSSGKQNIPHFLSYSAVTHNREIGYNEQNSQSLKNTFNQLSRKQAKQTNSQNSDLAFLRNTIGSGTSKRFQYNSYKHDDNKMDASLRQTTNDAKDIRDKLKLGSPLNFKKSKDFSRDDLSKSYQVSSKSSSSKETDNRLDSIMQKYQKKNQTKQAFKLLDELKQLKKKKEQLKKQRKTQQTGEQTSKTQADMPSSPLNFSKKNKVEYYTPNYDKKQQSSSKQINQFAYTPENGKTYLQKKYDLESLIKRQDKKQYKSIAYDNSTLSYQRQNKYSQNYDDSFNKSNPNLYNSYSYSQISNKDAMENSPILKQSIQQYKILDSDSTKRKQNYKTNFSASMVTYSDKNSTFDYSNKKLNSSSSYKLLTSKLQNDPFKNRKVTIQDFILGKNLGEGKFGVVYQAFDKRTKSVYAIKKVPKDMIKSHWMIDQFILQIKLQSFLNHQNLLGMFCCFDDSSHIYIVLQYMQQGTLFVLLKKKSFLTQNEAAIKLKEIASAVKYMHQNGIAHRDIKPQNIVMSHGVCKLCDFGWATICDQRRKTYCGTFDYAAPEILEGTQYDMSVDLWCLGILAYEIMVGKAPFYHISRKQTMKKIMNCQQQKIVYPSNMSKQAKSFIQSLIKKNPQERLRSEDLLNHPFLKHSHESKFK